MRADTASIADDAKLVRRSGRGIRRLVTLCGTVTQLVAEYDRRLLDSDPNSDDDDDADIDNEDLAPEKKEEIKR